MHWANHSAFEAFKKLQAVLVFFARTCLIICLILFFFPGAIRFLNVRRFSSRDNFVPFSSLSKPEVTLAWLGSEDHPELDDTW